MHIRNDTYWDGYPSDDGDGSEWFEDFVMTAALELGFLNAAERIAEAVTPEEALKWCAVYRNLQEAEIMDTVILKLQEGEDV